MVQVLPRPREIPVVPPVTRPIPLTGRRVVAVVEEPRVVRVRLVLTLGVLPRPVLRTVPRLDPRPPRVFNARRRSSSSALRAAASRCCCSASSRRSAACCLWMASFSMSATSWVAPCQLGFRIKRWLCSVWDSILVHVFRRVDADVTVFDTVYKSVVR